MKKMIDAKTHGIIDYAVAGMQLLMPEVLGLNKDAKDTYKITGVSVLLLNSLTDTDVGLKRLIPFRWHKVADAALLTKLSVLTLSGIIRKHPRTLYYHLAVLSLNLAVYSLTDFRELSKKR